MSSHCLGISKILSLPGSADWTVSGPSMCSSSQADGPTPEAFHKLYEVVFIDPSGMVNMAATMISADYLRVSSV